MTMTLTQKLKYFRDQMVSFFKDNPQGKYYKVIGWKTQYSPILDVLPRVKEVIPNAKKATLTIIGDDPLALSFEESTQPFPERSAEEIVDGWLEGYEIERMKSPDGLYAEVKFPCKFQLQGGLPDTFDIKWRGSKPTIVFAKRINDDKTYEYICSIADDQISKRIIIGLWKISTNEIKYTSGFGFKIRIGNKIEQISWGITEINYTIKDKEDIEIYCEYTYHGAKRTATHHITFYKTTKQGNDNTTTIIKSKPKDWIGFMLETNKTLGYHKEILNEVISHHKIPDTIIKYYDLSNSTAMYAIPVNMEFDGLYATNATTNDLIESKKVWGYDIIKIPIGEKYHNIEEYAWLGLWPNTQQAKTCSKQMYRDTMVNYFKNNPTSDNYKVIGWKDKYSPILDVSARVKKIMQNVSQAILTIYGDDLSKIQVSAPYDTKPPAFTDQEIIQHWQSGVEIERAYCQIDNKWYYVYFPCKLETKQQNQSNNTNNNITPISPQPTNTTTEIKNYVPFALLALGAAGIYLYSKRKYKRG